MDINTIPVISVSYNSAELIEDLLGSFRAHYSNPVTIIDGSSEQHYRAIEAVCARYADVRFIHFDYNIHHGPGMAWAFQNLGLHGRVLVLDSDIQVIRGGFLEDMAARLQPGMYGVGYVNHVNEGGFDVKYEEGAVRYLHPACMLLNIEVVREWPLPTKHGAPMTEAMLALRRAGRSDLVQGIDWLRNDFLAIETNQPRLYLRHDWQGTVKRSGSYNLEEWSAAAQAAAEIRLSVMAMLPPTARSIVELGANDGMLATSCVQADPQRRYVHAGSHPDNAALAADPDTLDDGFFRDHADADCWILDQALERSADPLQLLKNIRKVIKADASIIVVMPNAQHWSMQLRLAVGDLKYADHGLLSSGQRHWFSRGSLLNLLREAGYQMEQGVPLIRQPLTNPLLEATWKQLFSALGADPVLAFQDSQPDTYVLKARLAG
ncbi:MULTISPECIES: methyltransferase domain-containing protein [unclassified Duganella]|uniref:methyltransferase domain-containing protein n=1 Tax=unclassified Duganella TaxID=2636909 RepID=UPI000E3508B7|nr:MULTISPECIES: methyltransferase domain-containing protein [unclassified Duganella]RFP08077.1 methyltransferase domain-containing protein [Duganella sp. BJB475]RFP23882.1 methyltransferase domain-containing protein [Duganella sp. BJB476]